MRRPRGGSERRRGRAQGRRVLIHSSRILWRTSNSAQPREGLEALQLSAHNATNSQEKAVHINGGFYTTRGRELSLYLRRAF